MDARPWLLLEAASTSVESDSSLDFGGVKLGCTTGGEGHVFSDLVDVAMKRS